MLYLGDLENRMLDLHLNGDLQYSIKEYIRFHYKRYMGFNKDKSLDKLVLHFNGNNPTDLVQIHIPVSKREHIIAKVFRDKELYQTHVFEDLKELIARSDSIIWWSFNHLFESCGNFSI